LSLNSFFFLLPSSFFKSVVTDVVPTGAHNALLLRPKASEVVTAYGDGGVYAVRPFNDAGHLSDKFPLPDLLKFEFLNIDAL
jgi:hypothetical protein